MRIFSALASLGLLVSFLTLSEIVSAQTVLGEEAPPAGSWAAESDDPEYPCVPFEFYDPFSSLSRSGTPAIPFVSPDSLYSWPLGNDLHDDLILVNYVDDAPAFTIVRDYMLKPHSYDGHTGTDITLLNFRQMDRGIPVLAAADGVVLTMQDGKFDRNVAAGPFPANYVLLDHGNGTRSLYFHLRRGSTAVRVGETVRRGQLLGLAGSSGSSTDAHLHFETYVANAIRDPWSGTFNQLPSLWRHQEPYVGVAPLRIYDMGIFTDAAIDEGVPNVQFRSLKERISQPVTFGAGERFLGVWLQMQGQLGNTYGIDILRPDGSTFASVSSATIQGKLRYGWHYWYWTLRGIPESDFGKWKATVLIAGSPVRALEFAVGPQTAYPPRFWPVAGRSFHLEGGSVRDTLRVHLLGGPVTYALRNAPPFVSLDDDAVITINTPSLPRDRSTFFQVIASNSSGLQDTMWYHLVDLRAPSWVAAARLFQHQGHRTIPALVPDAPASTLGASACVRLEPVDGSFAGTDVDRSSIRMISSGTGITDAIGATDTKRAVVEDMDENGVDEVPACFALGDLTRLLGNVAGRRSVPVTIEADLVTGGRLRGDIDLTVVGAGPSLAAVVAGGPSPRARLAFQTRTAGPIKVTVFDVQGRLVQRLVDERFAAAGRHEVRLGELDANGKKVTSGVYFYRIEAVEGVGSGRFVLIK